MVFKGLYGESRALFVARRPVLPIGNQIVVAGVHQAVILQAKIMQSDGMND